VAITVDGGRIADRIEVRIAPSYQPAPDEWQLQRWTGLWNTARSAGKTRGLHPKPGSRRAIMGGHISIRIAS